MTSLATRVIEIRDHRVIPYPGGYDDYESARLRREAAVTTPAAAEPSGGRARRSPRSAEAPPPSTAPSLHPSPSRRTPSAAQTKRRLEALEQDLRGREARLHELEATLADPEIYRDGAKARDLLAEYERLRGEIETLWEKLAEL